VITDGTASCYHDLDAEIGRPSAGKTGTTNNFVDAWFIGFIPQLSTSVWVGYPDERTPMVNINGLPEINGENYPLDIWSLYMQDAASLFPEQEFDVPSPFMDLQIKTDGRAVPPETTEDTDETTESTDAKEPDSDETTESTDAKEPDSEDGSFFDEPAEPDPEQQRAFEPSPQSASPVPGSASPEPQPAPGGAGPRRGAPADNAGPQGRVDF
jgi:penicillin-binding protein 1A